MLPCAAEKKNVAFDLEEENASVVPPSNRRPAWRNDAESGDGADDVNLVVMDRVMTRRLQWENMFMDCACACACFVADTD